MKYEGLIANPSFVHSNGDVVIANPPYNENLWGSEPHTVIVSNPPYTVGDSLKSLFK